MQDTSTPTRILSAPEHPASTCSASAKHVEWQLVGTELDHRADIDGLRALAVLLVVCFHLRPHALPGGYLGVDIFFVISGYLITAQIYKEIRAGRFSIANFYERRVRRILPALVAVLVVTTIVALYCLLPGELIAYARSLLSAVFSFSNIYFWATADYFDAPAQSKPLLHTWSLAVEEQFYLLFPLLLSLLAKHRPQAIKRTILIVAAASFAWWLYASVEQPISAFYLPTSRAWELLIGSILALDMLPGIHRKWVRECVAAVGVVMIAYSSFAVTNDVGFPGYTACVACAGALLVLAAGRHGRSLVGDLLSTRPIAFIGLISYSVYLWHWPLIVFTKMGFLPIVPHGVYEATMLGFSLLLGALSWRSIETPFRRGTFRTTSRRRLFVVAASSMALCAAMAIVIFASRGFGGRFPAKAISIANIMNVPQQARAGSCFIATASRFEDFRRDICMQLDREKKNYLLIGDSHAAFLWFGLSRRMTNVHFLQATSAGCNPGIDTTGDGNCRRMMAYVYREFLTSHRVDQLILSASWLNEKSFAALTNTIAWCGAHKIRVTILGPVMEYDAPLPRLLAYSITWHEPDLARRHQRNELFAVNRALKRIAIAEWHVHFVSVMDAQCPDSSDCLTYANGSHSISLMFDGEHLSNTASAMLVEKLLASGQFQS